MPAAVPSIRQYHFGPDAGVSATDAFADVADHCTVCHRCETPCPVDIDFGDVTMAMRDLLRRMGRKRFNAGSAASMAFLNATHPRRSSWPAS